MNKREREREKVTIFSIEWKGNRSLKSASCFHSMERGREGESELEDERESELEDERDVFSSL